MTDVVCDLDGVIYRGDTEVPGAGEGLTLLTDAGVRVTFVTNNSTKPPDQVASKITRVAGVAVETGQVVTSSQAAASMLRDEDAPVLVVGEVGIDIALSSAGLEATTQPEKARAVVVGLCRDLSYATLADAASAIRAGARFIATNTDPTFPTSTGLLPGAGSIVAEIATASGREPEIAGKPHPAMRSLIRGQVGHDVWVVGDRVDTDMHMAQAEDGWRSVLVLSGVTDSSGARGRPDHVVADFRAAANLVLGAGSRQ